MEHKIEVYIKTDDGRTYSFMTPSPYPTKDDARNVMADLFAVNENLRFRVVPSYTDE